HQQLSLQVDTEAPGPGQELLPTEALRPRQGPYERVFCGVAEGRVSLGHQVQGDARRGAPQGEADGVIERGVEFDDVKATPFLALDDDRGPHAAGWAVHLEHGRRFVPLVTLARVRLPVAQQRCD